MATLAEPWTLDEHAHADPEQLDRRFVAAYDRKQGEDGVDDLAALHRHGFGAPSVLVDLGAGTGRFALAAAPHCRRVVAVDVSPAMIEFLANRAREAGVTNIECVRAGFLTYDHEGPSVDAVHTRNALHHLPDFWKAISLERIAGMLRAGGILRLRDIIYDFRPAEADAVISSWVQGGTTDAVSGYTPEDLAEHVRTEHSTFRWLLEPMIEAAGFDIVETEFERSVYGRYTCVKR